MKKLIYLICTLAIVLTGCKKFDPSDIWDNINSLDKRVTALEKLCKEMNTNISSLQTLVKALEKNDYITNVTPVTNNGEVIGYTISFVYSDPITIYHGEDGEDGKDGQDGEQGAAGQDGMTPVIGVEQDSDGVYYWTLNGDWLLDDNGQKIKAIGADGQDGADGAPGKDGADGKDGVTPQLKIEDDYWYVSYDGGKNWTRLGPAVGAQGPQGEAGPQGPQGAPGVGGDSMFSDVDYSSSKDYVVFVLGNGTEIKVPTWWAFEALQAQCEQMNQNIEALQVIVNALQNNDYITDISPIYEGVREIGYVITFSKSGKVTIYHGQDGKDGQNGAPGQNGADGEDGVDGSTPVIGVKKDADGIYYWTVNGEWLLDDNGQKVAASYSAGTGTPGTPGAPGQDGEDGQDGQDGAPGKDGVTPQLKIEDGYWFVSYDNGQTWTKLGAATGAQGPQGETGPQGPQGPQGNPGVGGDSMFSNVDYTSSKDYVTFVLGNGTEIKVPTWSAFEALQAQCEQMNQNIEALQVIVNALQNNDYITDISPIYEGGEEIGYVITFSKSGKVTIYHGQDGQNGAPGAPGQNGTDGEDGSTPVIGVKKDTDGIYYWTVNGQWLLDDNGQKVKAVGTDGKDGQNGAPGQNGTPGQDGAPGTPGAPGQDGEDGVTPQLKIENGKWYVSYDEGKTWIELGQATGAQGPQGNPGVGGDSMFSDVDYTTSKDYVIFVLGNGTQIKVPTWSAFEALQALCDQMNKDITALQTIVTALQNNDYVTSVTPIYEGGEEVGYKIIFSKSGEVIIYHGKDGKDGQNGAPGTPGAPGQNGTDGEDGVDGATPVIGVKKDSDGIYYWTVNGQWLLDDNGQKVRVTGNDGAPGTPGQNGAAGTPGKDGVTPQLKIEDGNWYVSYDNGQTWKLLGQATGDQGPQGNTGAQGPQGPQGPQGDSFFSNVEYDSNNVILTLSDGTEIIIPLASNGVSVKLSSVGEFSATFTGDIAQKGVDLKVSVYYSTSSSLSLYNYSGCVSKTSFSGNTFSLVVDKLYSETTYYYFVETINNGRASYSSVTTFRTNKVTGYDSSFDTSNATDLSAAGTANSYIVTNSGTYSISAVKGNSSTSVGTVASADVLWESFGTSTAPTRGDLVTGAQVKDGKIYFKTNSTFREGNALVAAKDAAGNILWSWHIWMTDQPEEQVWKNNAGTMLDRNLGATSATPGDVGALGLMYQWGRKDPFMGSSSISSVVEAKSTISFPSVKAATSTVGTVEYATKNPTTLIRGNNSNEWLYDEDDAEGLWATQKTIYDPCPAGWRVPDAGENGIWAKANGGYRIYTNPFDQTNRGVNLAGYVTSDKTKPVWFPATGYYGAANGVFYGVGEHGTYLSVTPGDTFGHLCFVIDSDDDDLYLLYVQDDGGADPVRCCKE